jgi:hypothetical protein
MKALVITFFLSLSPFFAWAGGSVSWSDVEEILQKQPEVLQMLELSLDVESVGGATRLGSNFAPSLGGARICPYEFHAQVKGTSKKVVVTILTDIVFFDDNHIVVSKMKNCDWVGDYDLENATSYLESFSSLTIKTL